MPGAQVSGIFNCSCILEIPRKLLLFLLFSTNAGVPPPPNIHKFVKSLAPNITTRKAKWTTQNKAFFNPDY